MLGEMKSYIERFERAIETLKRRLKQEFQERLAHLQIGLTGHQFFLMFMISRQEPCKITTLAEKMEVKPSAITVMIDRLAESGYVVRRPDEQDRRVVLVQLTEEGREILSKVIQIRKEMIEQLFSRIEPEELDLFLRIMEKLAASKEDEKF